VEGGGTAYKSRRGCGVVVWSLYAQDYGNWELLIVGDKCPQLDAFMEQHNAILAGSVFWGMCVGGGGKGELLLV
jgi:hypothetical protein